VVKGESISGLNIEPGTFRTRFIQHCDVHHLSNVMWNPIYIRLLLNDRRINDFFLVGWGGRMELKDSSLRLGYWANPKKSDNMCVDNKDCPSSRDLAIENTNFSCLRPWPSQTTALNIPLMKYLQLIRIVLWVPGLQTSGTLKHDWNTKNFLPFKQYRNWGKY
jgi:hypothetical protein